MTGISGALQALSMVLFLAGAASFAVLARGCFMLRRLRRTAPLDDGALLMKSPLVPAVSVIAVPPDVSPESREQVRRLLQIHFGSLEVVLVLDGPSETELATWTKEFRLYLSDRAGRGSLPTDGRIRGIYEPGDPLRLVVVDMERGGKAAAWNAGVNVAWAPLIGLIGAESEFDPAILLNLVRPMLEDPARTVAVCGVTPPAMCRGLAGRFGILESVRAWLSRCAAFAGGNAVVPIPGASMLVRRDAIIAAKGFRGGPLALFLELHGGARTAGEPYRIAFVPEGASHARAPRGAAELRRWVLRDQVEIARAWRLRGSITGGMWAIGWRLPALFLVRSARPLLETAAYLLAAVGWLTGSAGAELIGLVLLSTAGMGMVISMSAVVLGELAESRGSDPGRLAGLFFAAIPENLGYRQVRNLWLLAGLFGGVRS